MKKLLSIENLTLIGIILGIILGVTTPEYAKYLKILGDIFLSLLKAIVIPLIFVSIFVAIASLGSVEKFKEIGLKAFIYYFSTTALAVLTGLIVVNLIGFDTSGIKLSGSEELNVSKLTVEGFIKNLIPDNIFKSFVEGQAIHVILFSMALAISLFFINSDKRKLITNFFDGMNDAFLVIAKWIIALSPIGVFALIYYIVATKGIETILSLWQYVLVVLIGLFIHFFVNLGLILYIFGKENPISYLKKVREALLIAFSTCSSSATLPVSIEVAEKKAGIKKEVAGFVLPLGATINMDGTALYESVAAIFVANLYGMDLSITQQILIFITATLAAIGAAAIPSAGLVTMTLVFSTVGIPLEGIALIIAVDRFLDMFRTATNVWGDLVGAKVISLHLSRNR